MKQTFDWSRFTQKIRVVAPIEKIYRAWATQNGMEQWFLRSAEYLRPNAVLRYRDEPAQQGDDYSWRWHGYGDEVTEYGQILEANGTSLFSFTFQGGAKNNDMKVTVNLAADNGGCLVTLTQFNIPLSEEGKRLYHLGCSQGWTFYLTNLKSVMEGAADLRNKDEGLTGVVNA